MYPKIRNPKLVLAALGCVAAAVLTGCGQTDQEKVRQLTEDYIEAIGAGDYEAACELFTDAYRAELGGASGCARGQADQFAGPQGAPPELEIAAVRVKGSRGNVELTITREGGAPSPLTLLVVDDDEDNWRIRGQQ